MLHPPPELSKMKIAHWKIHGTLHHSSAWAVYPNSLVGKFRIWSALGVSNIAISCNCSWPRFGCQTLILSQLMCMYIYTIYTIICICNIYTYTYVHIQRVVMPNSVEVLDTKTSYEKLCPVVRWCPVYHAAWPLWQHSAHTSTWPEKRWERWRLGIHPMTWNVRKTQSAGLMWWQPTPIYRMDIQTQTIMTIMDAI